MAHQNVPWELRPEVLRDGNPEGVWRRVGGVLTREALGPDGFLVNVSRDSLVDETALCAALDAGVIGGATLDVCAEEPSVLPAFVERDDVVVLPHVATAIAETRREMAELVLANIRRFLADGHLVTPVPGGAAA